MVRSGIGSNRNNAIVFFLHEYDEVKSIDDDYDMVNENDGVDWANSVAPAAMICMRAVASERESEMLACLHLNL